MRRWLCRWTIPLGCHVDFTSSLEYYYWGIAPLPGMTTAEQPCYTLINIPSDVDPPSEQKLAEDLGKHRDVPFFAALLSALEACITTPARQLKSIFVCDLKNVKRGSPVNGIHSAFRFAFTVVAPQFSVPYVIAADCWSEVTNWNISFCSVWLGVSLSFSL